MDLIKGRVVELALKENAWDNLEKKLYQESCNN